MYNINDYVVYRKNVCKVKEIKRKDNDNKYYILVPINDESLKIEVPVSNNKSILRELIKKEEIDKLINEIPNINPLKDDDKMLESEYKNLLKSGTHEDLVKIIKTTYLRNKEREDNKKKISDKDKSYFEQAENYLYTELSVVLGMNFDETKKYIEEKVGSIARWNKNI